jgi:hypothetical protein
VRKIQKQAVAFMLMITLILSQSVYGAAQSALSDIKGNWAESYIQSLFSKGIITGNEKGMYEPKKSITRAEFTALLTRAMGLKGIEGSSFSDPGYSEYWARPYIEAAVAEGIIVPFEIGDSFFGSVPLKRVEMAVMMARALKLEPSDSQENPFADITEPNGYITKLYEEYLMRGYAESSKLLFKANNQTTKAEAATVVARILEYKVDPVKFKDIAAMEERFKNGTQTEEDIAVKRQVEMEKQAQSSTYIMEPILVVEYNTEEDYPIYFRIYFENLKDYSDESQYKIECTNFPQLNTIEMPTPTGAFRKIVLDQWRPLGTEYNDIRSSIYTLGTDYYATQEDMKTFKIVPGMKLNFKFTIIRGIETRIVNKTITVNEI